MNIPTVNWSSRDEIRSQAERILNEHHPSRTLPIPVDNIVDVKLNFDIVTIHGLKRNFDWDGFLAIGSDEIYVDEFIYENSNYETRYRFTLAHELGHIVLHRDVFEAVKITSFAVYKEFDGSLKQWQKHRMDSEANQFAAYLLIPDDQLATAFAAVEPGLRDNVSEARRQGLSPPYDEFVRGSAAAELHRDFHVSSMCMRIRLETAERDGIIVLP